MDQSIPFTYSAVIEMWLDCGQHGVVPLERIGPRSVVAKSPQTVPACDAELVVTVDGRPKRSPVVVTSGFRGRTAARVLPKDDAAPF